MYSSSKTAASVAALSIFMIGSAAFADVTGQQVWDGWKGYMTGFGYDVTGEENTDGDTLTVKDVTMALDLPEDSGSVAIKMPELSFTDNGDGTVSVQIPPVMPLMVDVDSPDAEDVDATLEYTTDEFQMTVSGDEADMLYAYSAAQVGIAMKNLTVDGEAMDLGKAVMTMADLEGSTAMKSGNLRMAEQKMTSGPVTYDIAFAEPEGEGSFELNGKFDSMAFDGTGAFPMEMDPENMAAMLKAGFAFNGGFTYQGGGYTLNASDDDGPMQVTSSSDSGNLQVVMDESHLAYAGNSTNMKMMMTGGGIPFPVELAMDEAAFNLSMPVSKSDEAQDFAFGLTLGDFTVSDTIWGMIDPGEQLPRDPATVAVDLTGKAKLNFDLLDPEQMEAIDDGEMMPGELNQLALNSLTVRLAGAELTGDGAFTFDNSDTTTFDGMPAPDGEVDLKLVGGNALMDKLVSMGLLPEEQATGARMMVGLFAVPGDGEDTLTSKIEVKSSGEVLANGQRLK